MVIAGLCYDVGLIGICPWHIREDGWESLEVSLVHPWLLGNRGIVHGMPCDIIVKNDAKLGNAPWIGALVSAGRMPSALCTSERGVVGVCCTLWLLELARM